MRVLRLVRKEKAMEEFSNVQENATEDKEKKLNKKTPSVL